MKAAEQSRGRGTSFFTDSSLSMVREAATRDVTCWAVRGKGRIVVIASEAVLKDSEQ